MKTKNLTLALIAGLGLGNIALSQDNRNYIPPTDSALKIDMKYDNPMRSAYQVGFNVGADVSTFSGGVFGEVTASVTPKFCTVKASYAFDLSNSDFISKSTLLSSGNKYGNLLIAAAYNFKDKTTKVNVKPTVGIDVTSSSVSNGVRTTEYYAYYTDYEVNTRHTTGIGISINTLSTNCFYNVTKVDSTVEFIQLKNGAITPSEFILPYNSAIIGLSLNISDFTNYKTIFSYNGLRKTKIKSTFFRTSSIELLYAISFSEADMIYYKDALGSVASSEVESVKKRPFGFKLSGTTNDFKKLKTKPGFYVNGELGIRPGINPSKAADENTAKWAQGIMSQPFYMKVGIGFAI